MIKQKLIDKFGGVINHMSCIYLNDGETVLRYFLNKIKPKTVIEIGTYQGVSAAVISEYAEKVFTIDVETQPLRDKIWKFLGIKNVKYIGVDRDKTKREFIEQMKGVDLIFIDGEHFGGELAKDFDMSKHCKHILIHDYSPSFKEVYDFCNTVKGFSKEHRGTFCLLTKNGTIISDESVAKTVGDIKDEMVKEINKEAPKKKKTRKKRAKKNG